MKNLLQRLFTQDSQKHMHVVVHNHVGVKFVALLVSMMQFRGDQIALRRRQFFVWRKPPSHEIDRVPVAVVWQASAVEVR